MLVVLFVEELLLVAVFVEELLLVVLFVEELLLVVFIFNPFVPIVLLLVHGLSKVRASSLIVNFNSCLLERFTSHVT